MSYLLKSALINYIDKLKELGKKFTIYESFLIIYETEQIQTNGMSHK